MRTSERTNIGAAIQRTGARPRARAGAAFTLIEAIVVIVIIGILATAIVPRMLNVGQREAELEAKAVQRLLSVAAEKCAIWNRPVAVDFNADKGTLGVWTQSEDPKATSDTTGAARVRWNFDPMVEPVAFNRLKVSLATQDGQPFNSTKWRVFFVPGQARPAMSIELEPKSERDGPRWTITLPAGETVATRSAGTDALHPAGTPGAASASRSIDLDDAGKGQTKW